MDVNSLLSEEFIAFSKKIEHIFEQKKAKKMELKAFYEKINADLKALDEEAAAAKADFENGKTVVPDPEPTPEPVHPEPTPTPEPTPEPVHPEPAPTPEPTPEPTPGSKMRR